MPITENRKGWDVQEEAVLHELLSLMGLTAEEKALLAALREHAADVAPRVTEAFYERLFKHENTAEFLRDASMKRLHSMVAEWFVDLFSGTYDEEYARKRMKIGRIHVQIGLPVRYPLAMLDLIIPAGESIARSSVEPEKAATAFRKVLSLDIAIFNHSYESFPIQQLADMVGNIRLARRLLSGSA